MNHHFCGLQELPFELTPNPRFLLLTRQHREALRALEYGLSTAKGVTALFDWEHEITHTLDTVESGREAVGDSRRQIFSPTEARSLFSHFDSEVRT
jgi:hypothetical protein